ncbi:hypothetical protein DERP_011556 [Dermatophagoides pteronyssinus]|uniref:Uncharacterized protein n=1 Tax=Dermatophagoides pteronyssinus TaxID=6956 RepID=A0ABQ8JCS6_DERPT|nr:hypothetical protein DERP_011556 [Dermatophagoides pteronyssinus]
MHSLNLVIMVELNLLLLVDIRLYRHFRYDGIAICCWTRTIDITDGLVVPAVVVVVVAVDETGTNANFLLFKFDAEIPNGAFDADDDEDVDDMDVDDDGMNIDDCDWIKVEPSSFVVVVVVVVVVVRRFNYIIDRIVRRTSKR